MNWVWQHPKETWNYWKILWDIIRAPFCIQTIIYYFWLNEIISLFRERIWLNWWLNVLWKNNRNWRVLLEPSMNCTESFLGYRKNCFALICFDHDLNCMFWEIHSFHYPLYRQLAIRSSYLCSLIWKEIGTPIYMARLTGKFEIYFTWEASYISDYN